MCRLAKKSLRKNIGMAVESVTATFCGEAIESFLSRMPISDGQISNQIFNSNLKSFTNWVYVIYPNFTVQIPIFFKSHIFHGQILKSNLVFYKIKNVNRLSKESQDSDI